MTWLIKAYFLFLHVRRLQAQVQAWKPGEANLRTARELEAIEKVLRRHR